TDQNVAAHEFLESLGFIADFVRPRVDVWKAEDTFLVGGARCDNAGLRVGRTDHNAGYYGAGRVGDRAHDAALARLRVDCWRYSQRQQEVQMTATEHIAPPAVSDQPSAKSEQRLARPDRRNYTPLPSTSDLFRVGGLNRFRE